jgi:hypothetical protein
MCQLPHSHVFQGSPARHKLESAMKPNTFALFCVCFLKIVFEKCVQTESALSCILICKTQTSNIQNNMVRFESVIAIKPAHAHAPHRPCRCCPTRMPNFCWICSLMSPKVSSSLSPWSNQGLHGHQGPHCHQGARCYRATLLFSSRTRHR